jgi:hypothetical protein
MEFRAAGANESSDFSVVSQFEIRCAWHPDSAMRFYNFIRIHKTLRVTPAMESGVADHLFSFEDLVGIVDEWEAREKVG